MTVDHTDGIGYGYACKNFAFVSLTVTSASRKPAIASSVSRSRRARRARPVGARRASRVPRPASSRTLYPSILRVVASSSRRRRRTVDARADGDGGGASRDARSALDARARRARGQDGGGRTRGGHGVEKCGRGVDVDAGARAMKRWSDCLAIGRMADKARTRDAREIVGRARARWRSSPRRRSGGRAFRSTRARW